MYNNELFHASMKILSNRAEQYGLRDDELRHVGQIGPRQSSYANPNYDYQKAHEYYEQHKKLKGRDSANNFTEEDRKRGQDVRMKQKGQRVREQQKQERLDKQQKEMLAKVMAEKARREGHGGQNVVNPSTSRPNYVTTEDMEDRNANLTAQKENLLSNVDEFKTLVAVKGDKSVDDYDADMREKYANNIDYDKIKNNLEVTNKYSSNSLRDRDGYIEKELDSLGNKLDAKLKELEKKYSIVKPPEDKDYEKKLKDIKLRFENIKADARINYEKAFNDVVGPRKDPNEISPIGFIKYTTSKNAEKKANKTQEQKDNETEVAENVINGINRHYNPFAPKINLKHFYNDTEELYHHGVENQKWGVRRYQNPDGSLTPEGVIHYGRYGEAGKKLTKDQKKALNKTKADIYRLGYDAQKQREWNNAADRLVKKTEKDYNKALKKYGEDNAKTQRNRSIYDTSLLIKEVQSQRLNDSVKKYKQATNDAINKYGNTRIKNLKNLKTTKTGEEFVKGSTGWFRDFTVDYDKKTNTTSFHKFSVRNNGYFVQYEYE